MPKQEFTAHGVAGSFPVPPLPAFSKTSIHQVRGGQSKKNIATCYGQIGQMKNMLMILEMCACLKGCY